MYSAVCCSGQTWVKAVASCAAMTVYKCRAGSWDYLCQSYTYLLISTDKLLHEWKLEVYREQHGFHTGICLLWHLFWFCPFCLFCFKDQHVPVSSTGMHSILRYQNEEQIIRDTTFDWLFISVSLPNWRAKIRCLVGYKSKTISRITADSAGLGKVPGRGDGVTIPTHQTQWWVSALYSLCVPPQSQQTSRHKTQHSWTGKLANKPHQQWQTGSNFCIYNCLQKTYHRI